MAVKFPELYLKANLIKTQSFPLTLTVERFKEHSIIRFRSIYPDSYPVFSFLDRRTFPIFLMLHSDPKVSTQIDMANAYYAMSRIEGFSKEDLFVIYCENENTYVVKRQQMIFMRNLERVEKIDGLPVLVLNEEYVWYPLMERDDRAKSPLLRRIVETLAKDGALPPLTDFEKGVVQLLRQITGEVKKDDAMKIVEISWSRTDPDTIRFRDPAAKVLLKVACYLSPVPAYLATLGVNLSFEWRIRVVGAEYLRHVPTHNYARPDDETENTPDSSYYMKAADCVAKSFTTSTVLDIIGVENYVVSGKDLGTSGHSWVYVRQFHLIINNAVIKERNTIVAIGYPDRPFKLIDMMVNGTEGRSFRWDSNRFFARGNLHPQKVIDLLTFAKNKYNDDFGSPNYFGEKRLVVPYEALIDQLRELAKTWKPPVGQELRLA